MWPLKINSKFCNFCHFSKGDFHAFIRVKPVAVNNPVTHLKIHIFSKFSRNKALIHKY